MNEKEIKSVSRFLSLLLRHKPEIIGLALNEEGWADVHELMQKWNGSIKLDRPLLEAVVSTNDKKRFSFNSSGTMIRANQGHSIQVELNLQTQMPPVLLYHGTVEKFLPSIQTEGLKKMGRQHVHLSVDEGTAVKVGSRRGKPVVLTIQSKSMHEAGFTFFLSDNGVWLTETVPPDYIIFPG
jgi:putative RNA 2'-phosphotransferase